MHPAVRNKWIVTMLILNMILWSIFTVGMAITFCATMNPLPLLIGGASAVGTWWMKRLMLELHAEPTPAQSPAMFRGRKRHAN